MAKEVIQVYADGYEQHIGLADSLEDAQKIIDTFPIHLRHHGELKVKGE